MNDQQIKEVADSLAKSFHGLTKCEPRREVFEEAARDAIKTMLRHPFSVND